MKKAKEGHMRDGDEVQEFTNFETIKDLASTLLLISTSLFEDLAELGSGGWHIRMFFTLFNGRTIILFL